MTRAFKRALFWSLGAHAALLLLIIVNPSLPKSSPKGQIRYVNLNLGGGGGGGGRGGGQAQLAETPLAKTSLKDLTTLQKLQESRPESQSSLRHPSDKKAKDKTAPNKKAVVTKPAPGAKTSARGGDAAGGGGSGLTIGGGGPGFGEGPGGGYGDQIGMSDFPFTWYTDTVRDRISSRWFQSLVDPGVSGTYRVTVHFRIYRNGSISPVTVRESSGLPALDLSARRAVTEAAPFGPLPPEFDEEYLGILLIFEHSK